MYIQLLNNFKTNKLNVVYRILKQIYTFFRIMYQYNVYCWVNVNLVMRSRVLYKVIQYFFTQQNTFFTEKILPHTKNKLRKVIQ